MKRITIKDVANEAGVSVTLVSFVMNAKRDENGKLDCPVNPKTASRVLEVAKRLGYKRNAAAASLRSGRSYTIAVIPTDISNKFFAGISRHIEDKAHEYGYTVLFGSSDESAEKLETVIDSVLAYNIDGIIVAPVVGSLGIIQKALDSNIPVILLDRDMPELEGVGRVLLNDEQAGLMATELLIKRGYRKIEMFSYDLSVSSFPGREQGYMKAMRQYGLEENIIVRRTTYENVSKDLPLFIQEAVKRGSDALFLPTYSLSAATLQELKKRKISVPKNLAVVGFDKSGIYSINTPTIAHILQPLQELGAKSVEMLHSLMENIPCETTFILNPILIDGESASPKI